MLRPLGLRSPPAGHELSLLRHYTLGDDDLGHIQERRRPENRLGFALQLCVLRYPGRALAAGEVIPHEVLSFIGAQLGVPADALLTYAARRQTRQEHMEALREIYGYKTFAGRGARDLRDWLFDQAEEARSNEDLAQRYKRPPWVEALRCALSKSRQTPLR